jgi:hypothetical protein
VQLTMVVSCTYVSRSSLNITSGTFTNNIAALYGDVMITLDSLVYIHTFINNNAAYRGGVMIRYLIRHLISPAVLSLTVQLTMVVLGDVMFSSRSSFHITIQWYFY